MSAKKKSVKNKPSTVKNDKDDLLMQNFISLQKVLTNLAVRVDSLTNQTAKLLSLFEISAKSFAQKQGSSINRDDKEFLEKLDRLIEQNKLIAKGITLMESKPKTNMQEEIVKKTDFKPRPFPPRI
ncbi:hypothetical protein COU53_03825 [Candidatus Pacearchaeota archaeon CG10_big_fil_rev_8_21_14_0_10_30_48]|nr:MAG: hypothetical protein COU53_03825 [Candidatus Pacearchaeota archaeon CG10_big_fil_rev_8_21_14_0_10_30_48]